MPEDHQITMARRDALRAAVERAVEGLRMARQFRDEANRELANHREMEERVRERAHKAQRDLAAAEITLDALSGKVVD